MSDVSGEMLESAAWYGSYSARNPVSNIFPMFEVFFTISRRR
jgi:hypothetical protein